MEQQTAVEWLAIQLYEKFEMKGDGKVFDDLVNQAKQMEKKQQIISELNGAGMAINNINKSTN